MANEHSQIVPSMQPTSTVADFKFWCQKVLPLVYDDSLSYYEVLNKMVIYLNQVIDNINADTANVAELEDDFLLLQTYVNNFFDDIDQLVTYTERAEAAQTAAAASAISAASSASNSATSASNAAGSASTAASMATTALNAKDATIAAKTAAEAALANAQTAATNAANSATAASGSATNAAASATAAQNSFTLADAARSAAQSAASSAESDAESAADSADEAVAAVDTIVNGLGTIAKTIENVPIATTEDALASFAKKLVVDIEPVQSGSGDPAPDNVRPITGWTGANVQRASKNLFNMPSHESFSNAGVTYSYNANTNTLSKTGTSTGTSGYNVDAITVPRGEYTFSANFSNESGSATSIYLRDAETDKNIMYLSTSNPSKTITLDGTYYIRVATATGATSGTITEIQLELGSSKTNYEPSNGTKIPITFPDAAGTVYGGTLTNEGGEWKLRVEKKHIKVANHFDTIDTDQTTGKKVFAYTTTEPLKPANSGIVADVISSAFKATSQNNLVSVDNSIAIPATGSKISIYASGYETVEAFATAFADVDIVFRLANPIEYTLTESQIFTLLNGINNVWADTGNINTLEYFTNAENYVTSQIDLAKALIAPVLKEMKADTALVTNDFRIVGNTLYRITGNIASGGTLTPNTNCVATTVGAILKSLLSA